MCQSIVVQIDTYTHIYILYYIYISTRPLLGTWHGSFGSSAFNFTNANMSTFPRSTWLTVDSWHCSVCSAAYRQLHGTRKTWSQETREPVLEIGSRMWPPPGHHLYFWFDHKDTDTSAFSHRGHTVNMRLHYFEHSFKDTGYCWLSISMVVVCCGRQFLK